MEATGEWSDTDYDACVFQGTRCKRQRLRHDVLELNLWPQNLLKCAHMHDANEWEPITDRAGSTYYPSKEEAESTAFFVFAVAVACSWWAVRTGRKAIQIPRLAPICPVGERTTWLGLHP